MQILVTLKLLAALVPLLGAPMPQAEPVTIWRAWLESPGGELPFGLELGGDGKAWIRNGSERIEARCTPEERALVLDFPHYDSRIRAELSEDGEQLAGEWTKTGMDGKQSRLPFRATLGAGPRFEPLPPEDEPRKPVYVDGRWSVDFASSEERAVGIFRTTSEGVEGTFLTTTGDYRFLAGSLEGQRLRLSCFDGAHAFLFDARLLPSGQLKGDFWSRDSWHETWEAWRSPNVDVRDPFKLTKWTGKVALADIVFPDLEGRRRSLADPAFHGKARIVQVFGSWCPNCHDEAAYLAELEEKYGERGLSIVGLAFELTSDFERNVRQVRRYKERHGVEYPILIAGPADKKEASRAFPALDLIRSYPTTLFLHADGRVRAVHTGFAGPATGDAHKKLRKEFEGLIEELLREAPR